MTTDTAVKYFDSTMSGAPTLSNVAGSLIDLLDACLINGFGSVTLDSLVVASNVATATVSAGHNFPLYGSTGPVITISGATPSALNGEWRIQTASSTQFTFSTSGISDQTATGTISAKRSPAGFSKAFSGTNLAAYRADNVQSNRLFLRIDATATNSARIRGYETMSDVDTGTGLFPTDTQISGGGYVFTANGANRAWMLVSDGLIIYFLCDSAGTGSWTGSFCFGDIIPYAGVDAYNTLILYASSATTSSALYLLSNTSNACLARSYTQIGGSATCARYSHGKTSAGFGYQGEAFPGLAHNGLNLWPVECWEGLTIARGMMPGLWNPIHDGNVPSGWFFDNIAGLPGRTIKVNNTANSTYEVGFDLTGSWR